MTKYEVEILGCTETNLEWTNQLQRKVKKNLPQEYQGPFLGSSGAGILKGKYLRGGTLQILSKRASGRQKHSGSDKLSGRWVWTELVVSDGRSIKIYTAYRSCKPPPLLGPNRRSSER